MKKVTEYKGKQILIEAKETGFYYTITSYIDGIVSNVYIAIDAKDIELKVRTIISSCMSNIDALKENKINIIDKLKELGFE